MAAKTKGKTKTVKYTVDEYLTLKADGGLSPKTIANYRKVFAVYAKFIGVPVDQVHNHLSAGNLLEFKRSRKDKSPSGTKTMLLILRPYFRENDVEIGNLEFKAMTPKITKEHNDKPLDMSSLQKMMNITDVHGKALLSFLISTGCRAGEASELLLSDIGRLVGGRFVPDINGDVVCIRNEIAKGGHGGPVFLNAEAREYLTLWLKERDYYTSFAIKRMKGLANAKPLPANDQRIFGTSYSSLHHWFARLYQKVDGEKGKYHDACTAHSCRKYFRTTAAKTMHVDLVTNLMRQTGYLDNVYVKITSEQKQKEYHAGEAALYILRADITREDMSTLEKENEALKERLAKVEQIQREKESIKIAGAEYISAEDIKALIDRVKVLESAALAGGKS